MFVVKPKDLAPRACCTWALRRALAAQEPSEERAKYEPALWREGEIGDHADDDAKREAHHGSHGDGGSDAHGTSLRLACRR